MTDEVVPKEPFPWMSKNKPTGPMRITLRHPLSEAITGLLLLLFDVLIVLVSPGAPVVLIVFLVVMFGGFAVLLLVMAAARWQWLRAYKRVNGYSPFQL